MRLRSLLCLVAVVLSASTACAEEETELTAKQILKAISIFAEAPLSEDGMDMASIIAKYAVESQDVVVTIDLGIHPLTSC